MMVSVVGRARTVEAVRMAVRAVAKNFMMAFCLFGVGVRGYIEGGDRRMDGRGFLTLVGRVGQGC